MHNQPHLYKLSFTLKYKKVTQSGPCLYLTSVLFLMMALKMVGAKFETCQDEEKWQDGLLDLTCP